MKNSPMDVVTATVQKHVGEAMLTLALLESKARTVPATTRSNNDMLRLAKKIKEAQAISDAWQVLLGRILMEAAES
jgi:hypothetical protein